jgi:hypothetical protein
MADLSADAAAYTSAQAAVVAFAQALPEPLPARCLSFLDRLLAGSFSRIVALLPLWCCELAPVPPATARQLGTAQLFGWWFISAQDDLLDGAAAPADLLGAHLALLQAVEVFRSLGVTELPCWPAFAALAATSAAGYAHEQAAPLDPAIHTPALVARRGALFRFTALAQCDLAGVPQMAPVRDDLLFVLNNLSLARQLSDDALDWAADLRNGRLNLVSAAFARTLPAEAIAAERIAGRMLAAEAIWAALEQQHGAVCAAALERLQPYGSQRLAELIAAEAHAGADRWADLCAQRATARQAIGAAADHAGDAI